MALGADPVTDLLATLAQQTTASVVDRVEIRTRYGPLIRISVPPAAEGGGEPAAERGPSIAQALQPEVKLYLKGKSDPAFSFAPYGPPTDDQWPLVRFALLVAAGTIGYFTFRGVTR